MPQISNELSLKEILLLVAKSRETAGDEEKTRLLTDQALNIVHDAAVNLYLEKCGVWQHVQMTERDKPVNKRDGRVLKKSINEWKKALEETEGYVKHFQIKRWQSRIDRFGGRLCDA